MWRLVCGCRAARRKSSSRRKRKTQDVDLTVDAVDAATSRFAEAGGQVVVAPFDIPIGRCSVVRDPWGNQLVLLDESKGLLATDSERNIIGNL